MKRKPLYKRVFKVVRDIVTLRKLRKKIKLLISVKGLRKYIQNIEANNSDRVVYIFQHQFFDRSGETCYNGGAERYCQDLANLLHQNNYQAILIQIGSSKKGVWERKVGHLKIIGLPIDDRVVYVNILKLFKKYEFVIYSGAVDWEEKIHPNILISHGITWDNPNNKEPIKNICKIFFDVDCLVSVDTNTISWLRTTFPISFDKMAMNYIPNYVDTSVYKPIKKAKSSKIQITFPRRASPERGYWLISQSLPAIMEKYSSVIFNFVGFAHKNKIIEDIQKLAAKFPGRINHYVCDPNEMSKIYQKSDISLIPTLYAEGTSLSCLEAQACGNVVISTNIGGLPNLIIDGYNGILINPDGQELMNALDRVLASKELCERLSKNAVSVAQAFDKKIWMRRWEAVIKSVAEEKK